MIRAFEYSDLDFVNNLLKKLNYKIDKDSFNNKFLNAIVYDDSMIKGILIYQYIYDRIEIDYIIVSDEYRKLGIATKLLKYLEKQYNNLINITLEVRESNEEAINFYLKNGFKKVAKREKYYNNEDGILMIKNLGE